MVNAKYLLAVLYYFSLFFIVILGCILRFFWCASQSHTKLLVAAVYLTWSFNVMSWLLILYECLLLLLQSHLLLFCFSLLITSPEQEEYDS
jgi:hypothetical protein